MVGQDVEQGITLFRSKQLLCGQTSLVEQLVKGLQDEPSPTVYMRQTILKHPGRKPRSIFIPKLGITTESSCLNSRYHTILKEANALGRFLNIQN